MQRCPVVMWERLIVAHVRQQARTLKSYTTINPEPYISPKPRGSKYPIIRYLGFWLRIIVVQVLGKYVIIRYLDP